MASMPIGAQPVRGIASRTGQVWVEEFEIFTRAYYKVNYVPYEKVDNSMLRWMYLTDPSPGFIPYL
ncbi:hypothetical protein ACTXT7_016762, partial [Hymenolepis weldensis]